MTEQGMHLIPSLFDDPANVTADADGHLSAPHTCPPRFSSRTLHYASPRERRITANEVSRTQALTARLLWATSRMTNPTRVLQTASRRRVWQAMASLVAIPLGMTSRSLRADTCAARGDACSILQPCCAGSRCRWLDNNLFVGVCSGGRATPAGVPVKAGRVSGRWSTPVGSVTCDDFESRRDARHYLRRTDGRNEARLDANGNGIPCESLPRK